MKYDSRPLSEVMRSTSLPRAGIIPACAGSTRGTSSSPCATRDHPRMCGEHLAMYCSSVSSLGSSPHVRGAHIGTNVEYGPYGIIPACAGSTCRRSVRWTGPWDHPRMCGEHPGSFALIVTSSGSSPHVRGAPSGARRLGSSTWDHPRMCGEHASDGYLITPCSGSSPHVRGAPCCRTAFGCLRWDHPRMCGEHV